MPARAQGLFDETTGLSWAVDSFAAPVPDPEAGVADLDEELWLGGPTMFAYGAVSPWLSFVGGEKYGRSVDRLAGLGITTVAACRTPVLRGDRIDAGFAHFRNLLSAEVPPLPDQAALETIVPTMSDPAVVT